MYEVGKLDSASIESLLLVLDSLVLGHDEGCVPLLFFMQPTPFFGKARPRRTLSTR